MQAAGLALVATVAAGLASAGPVRGAGESAVNTAAAAWTDLFGDRPEPAAGQRMIVVLAAPALADRMAQARTTPNEDQQKRWVAEAEAGQRLLVARLAERGIHVTPVHTFSRTINGFSATLDARAQGELERTDGVAGVFPARAVYPAGLSAQALSLRQLSAGSGRRPSLGLPGFDGKGVRIALLDSGVQIDHPSLGGRVQAGVDLVARDQRAAAEPNPSDPTRIEAHGTRMAGIIAAPRDGSSVGGIAYRSNLISVRHANGVAAVSSSDAAASVRGAAQNGSQVVVMAWESLNWWWQVSDEIEYWHYNRPILFVAAAGTSGCNDGILDSNVVFPADMPEVMAVTGITYPGGGVPCGIHHGSDVEVTAYLDIPSTGRYTGDVVGMGGSSNATAVVGSIAALTWSRNPGLTRDQLRARLQQSGAFYPSRNSEQGYGLVNALKAVRGY